MRAAARTFGLVMALVVATAVIALGTAGSAPTQAATGYWKFSSYATKPPQSELDAIMLNSHKAMPDRAYETRVSGAFQPKYAGKGSLDLYFKTDDVDRRVYLTTLKFSFTTDVDMLALTPGQKLQFKGVLIMGGNGLSKAMPARGSGKMAADNGDWFLTTEGAIDQTANGEGVIVVPNGGPGSILIISADGQAAALGSLGGKLEIYYEWVEGPVPPSADTATESGPPDGQGNPVLGGEILGPQINIAEIEGWSGTWIRRPGTDIFDAEWHNVGGSVVRDVIRIARLNGNEVVLTRDGNGGVYYGTISPDGGSIVGTTSWYPEGKTWSGTIGSGLPSKEPTPDSGISTPDGGGNDVARGDEPGFTINKPGEDRSPDSGGLMTGGDFAGGPGSGHWKTPATSSSAEFANNWNTAACNFTDTAGLDVRRAIHLDRFELWIKWRANERSTGYRVLFGGSDIGGGVVRRGDCDPYQSAWCTATDSPDVDLAPGLYKIRIDNKAICQNSGSGGAGFIRASGH